MKEFLNSFPTTKYIHIWPSSIDLFLDFLIIIHQTRLYAWDDRIGLPFSLTRVGSVLCDNEGPLAFCPRFPDQSSHTKFKVYWKCWKCNSLDLSVFKDPGIFAIQARTSLIISEIFAAFIGEENKQSIFADIRYATKKEDIYE